MKEQFVPYEMALKLKEKGFDEPCIKVYDVLGYLQDEKIMDEYGLEKILAPLWQQVFNWLADKYKIEILTTIGYEGTTMSFPGHLWRQFNICILEGGPLQSAAIFLEDDIYYNISGKELINNHFIPKALDLIP
jgi:hypothetical protein